MSIATLDGQSYVFDLKKIGLSPALRWYLTSPNMPKVVWDFDCEKKVIGNTFGIDLTTAGNGFYDAQNWARDSRVQLGVKTSLVDYVALFQDNYIKKQKEKFHAFNWNTTHWRFADTKEAIWYSACDSLYNLQVAVGLATTLRVPTQYKTIAGHLRRHAIKL